MKAGRPQVGWITPDYFFSVDAKIVPALARHYSIDWVVIHTPGSHRTTSGLLSDTFRPRTYTLRYRQRDPRIIAQYIDLVESIRKSGADLVYTSFHGLPYFFPVLYLLLGAKDVLYGVHNVHTPKGASNERAMRIYQRFAFTMFKHFHVFSKNQLRVITSLLPNKRHYYVPLAADDYGPTTVCPPTDRVRFLSFGYIRPYKRLDLLIRSFQKLRQAGIRDIELLIAGRCDDWRPYESLIANTPGITARPGLVPNAEIPDIVASSHYLVLPYQDSAQSAVLPLAYRYHRPVIASNIEAFREAVIPGSTGFLFENLSEEHLTAVMKNVVQHHDEIYDPLTQNVADHFRAQYSIEETVRRYRAFLDECLAGLNGSKSAGLPLHLRGAA